MQTTYSGYLVDLYCYGLVSSGGRALDGTDVIKAPWTHTIHCLRDPPQCINGGYYLAYNRGTAAEPNYRPVFTFDATGNAAAIALLRTIPFGDPRDHQDGYWRVRATGVSNGAGVLLNATMVRCTDDANCDGKCTGDCASLNTDIDVAVTVDPLLWAHMVLMSLSWGLLLPCGVLAALLLRGSPQTLGGAPIWFQGHRALQSIGWALQLAGLLCIVALKARSGSHFSTAHEQLGLVVVVIGSLQPVNAVLRHLSCIGHPSTDGGKSVGRRAWEWGHKGLGYGAVVLGAVNVVVGVVYAGQLLYTPSLVNAATALAVVCLGLVGIALLVGGWRWGASKMGRSD